MPFASSVDGRSLLKAQSCQFGSAGWGLPSRRTWPIKGSGWRVRASALRGTDPHFEKWSTMTLFANMASSYLRHRKEESWAVQVRPIIHGASGSRSFWPSHFFVLCPPRDCPRYTESVPLLAVQTLIAAYSGHEIVSDSSAEGAGGSGNDVAKIRGVGAVGVDGGQLALRTGGEVPCQVHDSRQRRR